ncbi:MAG: hypothetical protein CMJ58_10930 [Planctomycetaceae bacterium]|nr:hypothetical protein [Planctomycetaceae bacterium]
MIRTATVLSTALLAGWSAVGSAAIYTQDFEVDSTAAWTVNNGPSDAATDFFFDYSTVGIPAAPNGVGTRGAKLQANLANGIFSGVSASPTGVTLPSTYVLTFDWWANSVGPFPGGGSGSTNLSTFGVGTAGAAAQWPGGTQDSVWFAATGDGGSSADWRAYSTAAPVGYGEGDPVYTGASRNAPDPVYASFGNVAPPAAQAALFPNQTGNIQVGAAGFEWHEVQIVKSATSVKWIVDGVLLANVDPSTVAFGGSNFFIGHSDINASSSSDVNDAALLFTLIDNINVVPEPATGMLALAASAAGLALVRRRRGLRG